MLAKWLLAAMLAFMLAYVPSALYAEQLTITVDTDRRFYREGDSMHVYGEVSPFREGVLLNIKILSPEKILFSVSVLPEFDQQTDVARYGYSFLLVSEDLVTGDYMIITEYQKVQASKRVTILKSFAFNYTQDHDTIDVLVKNHRLSRVNLSSISLLLENITNPSFSFPEEWQIGVNVNENLIQLDAKGFDLKPDGQLQFGIRSESFLNNSYDLCWSSYGSSISIWLCNLVDTMKDNTIPVQDDAASVQNVTAVEKKESSKEDIAKKIKLPELKMPSIETLVIGYSFEMDAGEIKSEIKEILEQDEGIYYSMGSIDYVYYGANITSSDTNLYLKSNEDKLDFTLYLDDLSIENDYVDINLDAVKLNGQAFYNEENSVMKVTVPPQAALIEIVKAILHL